MSRGILQSALTNKSLELEYREPSQHWESEATFTSAISRPDLSTSEEFADLLSAM